MTTTKNWRTAEFAFCHSPILGDIPVRPTVGQIYALSDVRQYDDVPDETYLTLSEFGDEIEWPAAFFRVVEHGEG